MGTTGLMVTRRVQLASGLRLAVIESGAGVPALLVHAWGETHRTFDRVAPRLSTQLRLLAPDQRGVGDSDKPAEGYTLHQAAEDLVELLDAIDVPSTFVIGTSSGGYVAQQIAVDHPSRVQGLVLVGAPRTLAGVGDPFGAALNALHDPVSTEDVKPIHGAIAFRQPVPADFLANQERAALTIPTHVWRQTYSGLLTATPPLDAGQIIVPSLLIWGAADDMLPRSAIDQLNAEIREARLRVYERTGHMVLWEQPERVAEDILLFIGGVAGTQPNR